MRAFEHGKRLALLVTDIQNDFLPGGALPVPRADAIIPIVNGLIALFSAARRPVIYTRDWHPPGHISFRAQGGSWPSHCVQGTPGANLADSLHVVREATIIDKATNPTRDAYSAFDGTQLREILRQLRVDGVVVVGLATDYCVKHSALDALEHGFCVVVAEDAVAGIDETSGGVERAMAEMRHSGIDVVPAAEVMRLLHVEAERYV